MGKSIIIGSMNIQNKYRIPSYDGLDATGNDNVEILQSFLKDYNVDAVGTQELVRKFVDRLKVALEPKYRIYGDFRYGNTELVKKINFFDKYNETVSIITKHAVIKSQTTTMPWFPKDIKDVIRGLKVKSIRPRIVTTAIIDIPDFGKINFINTHLEHRLNIIQIRQLNYLQNMIKKSKYPVILTGDFNMDIESPRFKGFIYNLLELGYKRVPNAHKTYKYQKNKLPIDHIFIPKDWNIEEVEVVQDKYLEHFSDHYPILVRVSK